MIWAAYALTKWFAYIAWCGVGLRLFRERSAVLSLPALGLGTVRLTLGAAFGLAIFFAVNLLAVAIPPHSVGAALVLYLLVYPPTRWLEWSIVFGLIQPGARLRGTLIGVGANDRTWRAGGILISCVADIPVIAASGGLPVGRFLC